MTDKLEALSKPVAVMYADGDVLNKAQCGNVFDICCQAQSSLYSQEYVTALLDENQHLRVRVAEMKAKEEEARTKLINDTWDSIPAYQPPKHHGRGA